MKYRYATCIEHKDGTTEKTFFCQTLSEARGMLYAHEAVAHAGDIRRRYILDQTTGETLG